MGVNDKNAKSLESEMCAVGAFIICADKGKQAEALTLASPVMFTDERCRLLWELCGKLYERGVSIDGVAVIDEAKRAGVADRTGGADFVWACMEGTPGTIPVDYAKRVAAFYNSRQALKALDDIQRDVMAPDSKWADDKAAFLNRVLNVISLASGKGALTKDVGDLLPDSIDVAPDVNGEKPNIGIGKFDGAMNLFSPGEVTILAGRPGSGKSSLMRQIVRACAKTGRRALIYSIEVTPETMAAQFVCEEARVPLASWRKRLVSDEEAERVVFMSEEVARLPITFWARSSCTAMDVAIGVTHAVARQEPFGLVAIDYLGLMRHPKSERNDLAIGETTKALKQLALERKVPILLLHQLNRDSEKRGTQSEYDRPRLADLRDSGSIEQDADNVLFVWRKEREESRMPVEARVLTMAKYRNGQTFEVDVMFDKARGRFFDPEDSMGVTARAV